MGTCLLSEFAGSSLQSCYAATNENEVAFSAGAYVLVKSRRHLLLCLSAFIGMSKDVIPDDAAVAGSVLH